ncbi:MAG: CPXCG motif-containing cysteine-rich protein [Gammaproteobacteria bacterium]|nr:CPXCG motif-containing cysteine-rich protein [Gammaproteobacteria bacterium]
MEESFFNCPFCGESISMLLDVSVADQVFIEDCEVCCQPIEVSYRVVDDNIEDLTTDIT